MRKEKYYIRMFTKVLKEKGTDHYYWLNVSRLVEETEKYDFNGNMLQKKVELVETEECVISAKTIKRALQYCEGDIVDKDKHDPSISIKTIKSLGKALCEDEYAFLIRINKNNILKMLQETEKISGLTNAA